MTHASLEKENGTRTVNIRESSETFGNETEGLLSPQVGPRVALDELAAAIVHEVSQPLTAVLTNAEAGLRWMQRPSPDLGEVRRSMEAILAEGRRACEVIKGMKAFLGKEPLVREWLSVSALVADALQVVRIDLARAKVQVRLNVDATLPPIEGNKVQLQQVLVNLMLNATQAMSDQKAPRRLVVSASLPNDASIAIAVRDTGPGIARDHATRLFDPFFTTKRDGMGMGLAICRMAAAAHGGLIDVESAPGSGATFRLVIPVQAPSGRG